MEGKKFSASRGVQILVRDFLSRYDADALRYFLTIAGPETQDTDFTWSEFVRRNNDELVATWGNLVNRTLQSSYKNFGVVPEPGTARRIGRAAPPSGGRGIRVGRFVDRRCSLQECAAGCDAPCEPRKPVRRRASSMGESRDRPGARGDGPVRGAASCGQLEGAAGAVPPVFGAAAARDARIRGHDRGEPRSSRGFAKEMRSMSCLRATTGAGLDVGSRASFRRVRHSSSRRLSLQSWIRTRSSLMSSGGWKLLYTSSTTKTTRRCRRRDRLARASRRVRRAGRDPRRAGARGGSDAHRHDRDRHRLVPRRTRDRGCARGRVRRLGVDPHQAATPEAKRLDELRELLSHPKAVAVGETGLGHRSTVRVVARAAPALRRPARARRRALAPGCRPQPRSCRRDRRRARAVQRHGDPPLLLVAGAAPGRARSPVLRLVRRQRHLSEGAGATRRREGRALDRILVESDSPYLAPQPVRGRRNEPAYVTHTIAAVRSARDEDQHAFAVRTDENATAAFGLP